MLGRHRSSLQTIVFLMLFAWPTHGWTQLTTLSDLAVTAASPQSSQYVMTGKLELRPQGYALVSGTGELEAYLIPRKSLDLTSFVGQTVDATVREPVVRTGSEPRLWLDQVELPKQQVNAVASGTLFDPSVPGRIALAQYAEPLVTQQAPGSVVTVSDRLVPESWGPRGWIWGSADVLYWWSDGMYVPPLVTTSPAGTPREEAGVLGESDTEILYGNEDIFSGGRNGLRLRLGVWFDKKNRYALQGEYFELAKGSASYTASCDGTGLPILARPFFNINPRDPFTGAFDPPAREDSQLICYPDLLRGDVAVEARSRLQSASLAFRELLALETFCSEQGTGFSRVDVIAGYRFMRLEEHLGLTENLNSFSSEIPVSFQITDQFDTRNQFHGIDLGMAWQAGWGKWSMDLLVKTAVGSVQQEVVIQGGSSATLPGASPVSYDGGLLALPSNIGSYSQDRVAVVPELGITLGYAVLPRLRATVGYSLIYWGTVVRPGDQIDLDVNPDQLPPPVVPMVGALRPEFTFQEVDYWVHGVNVGLEGRW